MVELKSRRLFLKRSPCPSHLTVKDFAIGSKVTDERSEIMKSMYPTTYLNQASRLLLLPAAWAYPAACSRRAQVILYGRDLTIAAYADKPTETSLTPDTVSLCVVPSLRHAVGVGGVGGVTAAVAVVGRCGDGGGDSVVVRVGGGGLSLIHI